MRLGPLLLAAFGLFAVVLGGWTAMQEASQFVSAPLNGADRLQALLSDTLSPGLSGDANRAYAETCVDATRRLDARMLAAAQRNQLDDVCLWRVAALAERTPVNSFLWLAQAQLAFQSHDGAALNRGLVQSVATGPNEYWIATRRFNFGERALAELSPDAMQAHLSNMATLAGTAQGNRALAARFVYVPEFRERATALVETLPAAQQHLFLLNVEQFTKQRRPSP